MSFYGQIIKPLENLFKFIKVEETTFTANGNSAIEFKAGENIILTPNEEEKSIEISTPTISLQQIDAENKQDNELKYQLKIGEKSAGEINIPLDLILSSGEIVSKDDKGNEGTFLKLTLKTSENGLSDVYINVADLNEFSGTENSTSINLSVTKGILKAEIIMDYIQDNIEFPNNVVKEVGIAKIPEAYQVVLVQTLYDDTTETKATLAEYDPTNKTLILFGGNN